MLNIQPPSSNRLVVFADDWGRHPSSCQHLVRHLLDRWQVTWVNTIGTRSPGLNWQTVRRGWEKVNEWRCAARLQEPRGSVESFGPRVLAPRMWPRFSTGVERELNRKLLCRFLRRELPELEHSIVLTTLPIVADLVGRIPARKWVYYCVDDFSCWPGLDARPLRLMEDRLIARVDQVVAAGENLADRVSGRARCTTVVSHGVDLAFWAAENNPAPPPVGLDSLESPWVVFWGLIDRRLDVAMLHALGSRMRRGSLVLVGPQQDPDPRLETVPRLHRVGPYPFAQLPSIASAATALIMPYADLPVTRAMQPLKLKEYLATGKPVIATPLPAVQPWNDCLDTSADPTGFAAAVLARLEGGLPRPQRDARRRLAEESWQAKAMALEAALLDPMTPATREPLVAAPPQDQMC